MKKLLLRVAVALIILLILGTIAMGLFLDSAVKRAVQTVGPMYAKVDVKVDSVSLSLLSGGGKLEGLLIGNPPGYKSPSALQVGKASLSLKPGSLFADKIIIKSINLQSPEITFETDLKGNNLSKIVSNLQSASGGGTAGASDSKASRKLQVDDFLITGGKIHVSVTALGTQSATVPLPEIHLTNLGQGPEGITGPELAKLALQEIEKEAVKVSASAITQLTKDPAALTKELQGKANGAAETISKGIGGLLKKN